MSELGAAIERIKQYIEKEKHTYGNTLFLQDLTLITNSVTEKKEEPHFYLSKDWNEERQEVTKELSGEQNKKETDAIVFYQNNFGNIRPYMTDELLNWIDDTSDEIVIYAMKKALDQTKPSWGYTKAILQQWHNKNIRTMEQIKADETEFQRRQQHNGFFVNKFQIDEEDSHNNPEWLKQGEHMKKPKEEQEKPQEETEMEKRLKELMKTHNEGAGADE